MFNTKQTSLIALCLLSFSMQRSIAQPAVVVEGLLAPSQDLTIKNGDLVILDGPSQNDVRTRLDSDSGDWRGIDPNGNTVMLLRQVGRDLFLGGHGRAGDIVLLPREANDQQLQSASVHIDGRDASQRLGGGGVDGQFVLQTMSGDQVVLLSAADAAIVLGQNGEDGDIIVRDGAGTPRATIDGETGQVTAAQFLPTRAGVAAQGIDTASIYVSNRNPSIALHDTTNGNQAGWYMQSGSTGNLIFHSGTTSEVGERRFVLDADGSVCIGACEQ